MNKKINGKNRNLLYGRIFNNLCSYFPLQGVELTSPPHSEQWLTQSLASKGQSLHVGESGWTVEKPVRHDLEQVSRSSSPGMSQVEGTDCLA